MHMSVVWSPEQSPAPLRRSPSLESIPSSVMPAAEPYRSNMVDISASTSTAYIGGVASTSDQVSSQSDVPLVQVDWIEGEFKAWLNERAAAREAKAKTDEPPPPPVPSRPAKDAPYTKHQRYCFPAESIHFIVEDVLYSVHRYFFKRDSSVFAGKGLTEAAPMALEGVSTAHFDQFLSVIYPSEYGFYTASTVEEWTAILSLADRWGFKLIRALAIKQLAPIASEIDYIVLGRQYGVEKWLSDAYEAVCMRNMPLTLEEGRRLGVDDVIRINNIRQVFGFGEPSVLNISLVNRGVRAAFGLTAVGTAVGDDEADGSAWSKPDWYRFGIFGTPKLSQFPQRKKENVKAAPVAAEWGDIPGPVDSAVDEWCPQFEAPPPGASGYVAAEPEPAPPPDFGPLTPKERRRQQKEVKERMEKEKRERELVEQETLDLDVRRVE